MENKEPNPYCPPTVREQLLPKMTVRMKTPHVRFIALAVVAVIFAPFSMCVSIAMALFVGPIIDRVWWAKMSGANSGVSIWRQVSMAFATTVPLIIASFIAFFSVCAPTGGIVFVLGDPIFIGSGGDAAYGLMLLFGGLILLVSTYLGLLLPFRIWQSKGYFDLEKATN